MSDAEDGVGDYRNIEAIGYVDFPIRRTDSFEKLAKDARQIESKMEEYPDLGSNFQLG